MTKYQELQSLVAGMISGAGSGHYATSMSALEIMYPLFYGDKIKPEQFILSKGHAAPALYAILFDLGSIDSLDTFRRYGGLPGHPELGVKGVLCSSGSLGMGISKALGLARMHPNITYHVLVGDGELQEGQNWEALMYLTANHVENVIVHVDCNGQQYSGEVGDRGLASLSLFYTDRKHILKGVKLHLTKWENDNKYLTRPQMPEYAAKVKRYGQRLYELMGLNDKIVVLDADLVDDFALQKVRENFPRRFIECGISEQHMVSMANGIALSGYYPVCHTFSAFYKRCIDQIYNNCCDNLRIMYVAGLAGNPPMNIGDSHKQTPLNLISSIHPNLILLDSFEEILSLPLSKSGFWELSIK